MPSNIEEGISRGLWTDSSHSDSKGKKPGSGHRPSDVGTIGMTGHRSAHRPSFQSQFLGTPYQMIQHDRYRPVAPIRLVGTTYLHPPPQSVYATQAPQRPPMQFHHQYRAPPPPRSVRQFTQLGMPLSRAFQRLVEGGLIAPLPPRPPLQPTPPGFRTDLHCAYHQRAGHDTDSCLGLRHAIQDLIDQGLVDLGRPGVATDPLPTHDTRIVPPPSEGIPRSFSLTPDNIYEPPPVSPVYLQHVPPMTPFILFPEEYRPPHRDVQIVTRTGRVAQPPPVDRPFAGIVAREEIKVDTATTPEGLIHMLTVDRATCIVFSDDDLPPEGSNHVRPLFIDVVCSGRRVPSVLLDNGSALNVCPLVTAIALGFSPIDFRASTQTVRAYDETQRTKVKFIHKGRIIMIQSNRDIITSSEPVLHISHSENDLYLTGFTFDEVQVVSLENGSRDMVLMSFDQQSSTLVLSMMRGMSYLPGMGLGRRQDRVRARMIGIPFDYPLRPYTFQLADYFIRGSEHTPCTEGTVCIPKTIEIQDIHQALGQMHLDTGTTEMPGAMIVAPPSPNRASVFSMCFPRGAPRGPHTAFDMFGVSILETDGDDSVPDAYTDDMDFIGIGRILDAAPHGPHSAFDISGVSVLDDESVLDVVTSDFTSVEGASDFVDPPLSFDTMSGFVTRFDAPTTHIYDVDDVGDTDNPLGGQSEFDSDTEDEKVTPISGSTELIDFGAPDWPREIRIGSSLSLDERSRLIDLLRSYLDVFAWSYEDMPGLDPSIVKEEIRKQLSVGFLSVVEYPEWLANVVPVPKKDGKILMALEDMEKTSFITEWGSQESNSSNSMQFGVEMKELQPLQADHSKLKEDFCTAAKSAFCCENFAAILHSARLSGACSQGIIQPNSEDFFSEDERLGISSLGAKVINFVDYSLNQGAPTGHESAETPSGQESNGAVAGDESNGAVAGDGATLHCACHVEYEIAEEAMNFMSYVAEFSRGWDEPNASDMGRMTSQPNAKGEMYILNDGIDMRTKFAAMERRLEELEMKNMQEVQAISQTPLLPMPCSICRSYEHLVDECPTIPAEREMFGDCNTYNSNWRDHPNFSWKPQPPQYKQHVQALLQASSLKQAMVNLSKVVETLLELRNPSMLSSVKELTV
ncbi:hypothetical protein CK203_110480 [Vitis vinifera]|uniref:Uncharacterized protein n=1 Tax=Vitis vinifera TaxID=29760 RepID=A0A438CE18_VITVI|nr:hypothetical protein CK203_110480 [Vitis vinifera]